MASVLRQRTSKFYTAVWRVPDETKKEGYRQVWKSTKSADQKKAQGIADHWEKLETTKRLGEAFRSRTIELVRALRGGEKQIPVTDYINAWLEKQQYQVKPVSYEFYKAKLKPIMTYLKKEGLDKCDIAGLDQNRLQQFFHAERKRVSAASVNHEIKMLRMVFKAARLEKIIIEDPMEGIKTFRKVEVTAADKKAMKEPRRPFTPTELQAALGVADEEWESMIMFGLYFGPRLLDIATLTRRKVELKSRKLEFTTSKTGKDMVLAMGDAFHRWIATKKLPDNPDAPLHPRAFGVVQRTGKTAGLSSAFGELLAVAGLRPSISKDPKKENIKGRSARRNAYALSFHSLRYTNITYLQLAGASKGIAMDAGGHSSEAMSQIYTKVDYDMKRKYADAMPDVWAVK